MLEANTFVVQGNEIRDNTGKILGTVARAPRSFATRLGALIGAVNTQLDFYERIEADEPLVFSVRHSGWLFKNVEVLDSQGVLVGTYDALRFHSGSGFLIYDHHGELVAEIRSQLPKSDYTFFQPDSQTDLGKVTRTSTGCAVQIEPAFAENPALKMLLLGAAIFFQGDLC